jgi:hypothetical protein
VINNSIAALCAGLFLLSAPVPTLAEGAAGAFTVDGRVALSAYESIVEEHLASALDGLKALAETQDIQSTEWDRMKGPLARLSADMPTDAVLWFAKPDGSFHTTMVGMSDKNLKDRDYFPTLLAGKDVTDALVTGKTTGVRNVIVATPVMKDGKVIGALGVSISLDKFTKLVDEALGLPKDIIFYALYKNGQVPLHRETFKLLSFPSKVGGDSLKAAVEEMLSKPEGTESYTVDGVTKTAIFKKSARTGWVFVLGRAH